MLLVGFYHLLLAICISFFLTAVETEETVVVATKYGQIRGLQLRPIVNPTSKVPVEVCQFTAIPFARPPIGKLRFKKPAPIQQQWGTFTGVLDATKEPNACKQNPNSAASDDSGDENCLFLNIWVPKHVLEANNEQQQQQQQRLLSVYVFIHGGDFAAGSAKHPGINGSYLAALNDIIVVTIQYRLGSLGFAYLGTEEVPGNMGMWDQLEALKWVNENIGSFGGNSSEVTIGGQNAGAVSVTLHLLSPHSRPYFNRAIIQSGTTISSPWGVNSREVALAATQMIFDTICTNQTYGNKMACLTSVDGGKYPQTDEMPRTHIYEHVFHPVVDGDFIPYNPMKMLLAGDYHRVPILIGANRDEGTAFVAMSPVLLPSPERSIESLTKDTYPALIADRFKQYGGERRVDVRNEPLLTEAIQLHYWPSSINHHHHDGNANKGSEIFQSVSKAYGDYALSCPTYSWSKIVSENIARVFAYHFTQRRSAHPFPDFMGVMHGDELPFVFGNGLFEEGTQFTQQEKQLSQIIMNYWGNFIKYGDPNGADFIKRNQLPKWPRFFGTICSTQYLELNTNVTEFDNAICGLKDRECVFWNDYMAKLASKLLGLFDYGQNNQLSASSPSSSFPVQPAWNPELIIRSAPHPQSITTALGLPLFVRPSQNVIWPQLQLPVGLPVFIQPQASTNWGYDINTSEVASPRLHLLLMRRKRSGTKK